MSKAKKIEDPCFWGIDCGSAAIKVALCDAKGRVLWTERARTLFPLEEHVRSVLSRSNCSPLPSSGNGVAENHTVVATGYGRHHVSFAHERVTEIKAHFLGVRHGLAGDKKDPLGADFELIDIGGQDSKVIHVKKGQIAHFDINRKCAAGTGAFIEELAHRLELKIESLSELAAGCDREIVLNSFCTVFAAQEALKLLMEGEKIENVIRSLYESVAKRVLEMTPIESPRVVFSGGVMSYHPTLLEVFRKSLDGKKLSVAPQAEFCGAIGAALCGMEAG